MFPLGLIAVGQNSFGEAGHFSPSLNLVTPDCLPLSLAVLSCGMPSALSESWWPPTRPHFTFCFQSLKWLQVTSIHSTTFRAGQSPHRRVFKFWFPNPGYTTEARVTVVILTGGLAPQSS
ncbi:hypothetical protein PC111_g15120 [Phytophthora cactorum]|nr:hypothetical protein PC111_g15120 [Phytophthora cactorum]